MALSCGNLAPRRATRCPSRRQVERTIRIQTPLEPILDPSCTQHRPQDGPTTPSKTPKTRQNHQKPKENHRFLLVRPCPSMLPKSSPRPPKTPPKSAMLGPRCPQDSQVQLKTPILTSLWTIWGPTWSHLGPNFAHLVPNFAQNSDRIAPNMPGRTRRPFQITIFLDFGPLQTTIFNDFGYILLVFPRLFCTLRPTSELYFRPLG